jgi:hypothetical protein
VVGGGGGGREGRSGNDGVEEGVGGETTLEMLSAMTYPRVLCGASIMGGEAEGVEAAIAVARVSELGGAGAGESEISDIVGGIMKASPL